MGKHVESGVNGSVAIKAQDAAASATAGQAPRRIAIITGATSGVGLEFARQLDAGDGGQLDELWLIARSKERLAATAAQLAHHTRVFSIDLSLDG